MTILQSVLKFIGASATSGITWDVLKYSGETLINKFCNKFVKNGCFNNQEQGRKLVKDISEKEAISEKNPYNDVEIIYENIVEDTKDEFIELFKQWIEENIDELVKITKVTSQQVSVKVQNQMNFGSGMIVNAGIINKG